MSSTIPIFLCNNWDQVSKQEADSIKHRVVRALREEWHELDPDFQIIYISSPNATNGGLVVEEFALLMDAVKSSALQNIKATLQRQWRWLDFVISRMAYHMKMVMDFLCSPTDRKIVSDLHSERLCDVEKRLCSVEYELQEHFRKLADDAVRILSNHLQSCKVVEKFTSWTLDDIPDTGESWEVTDYFIQDALRERLQNTIAAWEDENQMLSRARTFMVQLSHQRFDESKSFLPFRYLENSVIADDYTGGPNICLTSNDFGAAQKVMIGVTSPIWVPVGLAVLVGSVPVIGARCWDGKPNNRPDAAECHKVLTRLSQKVYPQSP
ncbi:hypothetical protein AWC38_SpisGene20448 [Stylophora pistillata]|uniref:Uncharacterized protein n=1 Tax=Stylophora pistillata TaxID=50429 RepID=A0A2B4RAF6_STYPI|nr:hypothetical protein AWC38_SpisGene20448 [Stylophora pistillata]